MDFGIFCLMNQRRKAHAPRQIFRQTVAEVQAAEAAGFAVAWFAEHHFSNYSLCPSPLMMAAHCAPQTRRIKLGTGVVVLPLYTPARLLAEIGFVDNLSDGRLVLGVGSGYQPYEFARFGGDLSESKGRTLELIDMIEQGLTRESFAYDGTYFRQPETRIPLQPLQKPLPPIWIAGAAPDLIARAGVHDYPLIVTTRYFGVDFMKDSKDWCAKNYAAAGHDPARMKFSILSGALVTESRGDAEAFAENMRYQARLAISLRNREENMVDGMLREQPLDDEPSLDQIIDNVLIGDVNRCVELCLEIAERVNPHHISLYFGLGDFDHEKTLRSIRRFGEEVIPAVNSHLRGRDKAAGDAASAA